uniref:Apoptosis-associated speck-like protein containing a CARD n=1 Tax=Fundulus heteroclitus TaxID=8078 RepID=A0A3Q2PCV4_FUNHE
MAPKTPKKVLRDILEDLKDADFQKFRVELLERKDGVKTSQVEGKGFLDVADVMVSVYTEKKVLLVADEILREIRCHGAADELAEAAKKAGFPYQGGSSGEAKEAKQESLRSPDAASGEEEHFVDQHMVELVQRVTSIAPILDKLLKAKIMQDETYDEISALPTCQAKMRALYRGPLKGGKRCKDVFYEILEELEPFLIKDLMGK